MSSTLYVMCGLPGSGKSTLTEKLNKEGALIVSTDALRKELFGDESSQKGNEVVFGEAYRRTKEALEKGKKVVFDATNVTADARKRVLDCADANTTKVCIYMNTTFETCMARNSARERKVPGYVILRMHQKFQKPTKAEGFDRVLYVK